MLHSVLLVSTRVRGVTRVVVVVVVVETTVPASHTHTHATACLPACHSLLACLRMRDAHALERVWSVHASVQGMVPA